MIIELPKTRGAPVEALSPSSSALFLTGKSKDQEKLLEEIRPFKARFATTTLSEEGEKRLKATLAREE